MIEIGVILAGGQGRRLGGVDKARLELGGVALHAIVAGKLSRSCKSLVVAAPVKPLWADAAGIGFVQDVSAPDGTSLGPVGGLLGALRYLASAAQDGCLVTAPVDVPFFPEVVIGALSEGLHGHRGAVLRAAGRLQPVFGAWRATVLADLEALVWNENEFALHRIVDRLGAAIIDCDDAGDAFLNINTADDLNRARNLADGQ